LIFSAVGSESSAGQGIAAKKTGRAVDGRRSAVSANPGQPLPFGEWCQRGSSFPPEATPSSICLQECGQLFARSSGASGFAEYPQPWCRLGKCAKHQEQQRSGPYRPYESKSKCKSAL